MRCFKWFEYVCAGTGAKAICMNKSWNSVLFLNFIQTLVSRHNSSRRFACSKDLHTNSILWSACIFFNIALRPQRLYGLCPGRPPRLSHSPWALRSAQSHCMQITMTYNYNKLIVGLCLVTHNTTLFEVSRPLHKESVQKKRHTKEHSHLPIKKELLLLLGYRSWVPT